MKVKQHCSATARETWRHSRAPWKGPLLLKGKGKVERREICVKGRRGGTDIGTGSE